MRSPAAESEIIFPCVNRIKPISSMDSFRFRYWPGDALLKVPESNTEQNPLVISAPFVEKSAPRYDEELFFDALLESNEKNPSLQFLAMLFPTSNIL
jgi:hypothetical protein